MSTLMYHQEIEKALQLSAKGNDRIKTEKLKKYIGTQLKTHGLTSATQKQLFKTGFSFHSSDYEQTFKIYNAIYKEHTSFEAKNLAFLYLDKNYKHVDVTLQLELLPHWVKTVDNWAHSDTLSKFLTRLLENSSTQKSLLAILKKWNTSTELWERRQSLICLYYYARTKKQLVDYAFSEKLIANLLEDKEYYVQKAVGWALRESYNAYPTQTYLFIKKNIKQISSTAFTTCLEKMLDKEKQALKAKRKQ